MTRPLFPFNARHVEHAVCLITTVVVIYWARGLDSAGNVLGHGLTCLYLCGLAVCVEEVVVIPGARRRAHVDGDGHHSVYRHASNPGLALGSCVVPWVCMVLGLHWALACSVLSTTIVLVWTAVFDRGHGWYTEETGRGSGLPSLKAGGISMWIVGWCSWQLSSELWSQCAGLSFLWIMSAVALFFLVRWLVPGTCTMGESVAVSSAVAGVIWEGICGFIHDDEQDVIGELVAAGLLAFLSALVWVVRSSRGAGAFERVERVETTETSWVDSRAPSSIRRSCISTISIISIISASGSVVLSIPFLRRVPMLLAEYGQDAASMRLVVFWVVCLTASVPCMMLLKRRGVRNIMLRKGFHLLALLLFVPPLATDVGHVAGPGWAPRITPHDTLLPLALAVAFIVFLTLEIIRLGDVSLPRGVERHIHRFMSSFVDARDTQGELYVTHITLLLGLAVPIWLGSSMVAFSGIIVTGIGDASASIVGSLYGRRAIAVGTKKTVEGTAACFVSMLVSWLALAMWYQVPPGAMQWSRVVAATSLSSLLESVTDSMDNIFVSSHYFCLLVCLCAH